MTHQVGGRGHLECDGEFPHDKQFREVATDNFVQEIGHLIDQLRGEALRKYNGVVPAM